MLMLTGRWKETTYTHKRPRLVVMLLLLRKIESATSHVQEEPSMLRAYCIHQSPNKTSTNYSPKPMHIHRSLNIKIIAKSKHAIVDIPGW